MRSSNPGNSHPRVFVSSVVEGFQEYREAARAGIEAAGGEPVLVNEDFPSLATSSRNACLDAVESSDIYIAVIGSRGGWTAPSGRLVVEEEYEQARAKGLTILVFVQETTRDDDGEQLVRKLSDYVDGRFRVQFRTPDDLRAAVEQALRRPTEHYRRPAVSPDHVLEPLQRPHRLQSGAALHFVLVPERAEEVVDPVMLDGADFRHDLYETALHRDVRLLSHEAPKRYEVLRDSAVIRQGEDQGRRGGEPETRIEVEVNGRLRIDTAVTGRQRGGSPFGFEGMTLVRVDLEDALRATFAFCAAFYERLDPYRRYERFLYSVALSGLRHKQWVEEARPTNTMSFGMREPADPLILLPEPRTVNRDVLPAPGQEVERIVTYARRGLQ